MNPTNILYDFDDYSEIYIKNVTVLLQKYLIQSTFSNSIFYLFFLLTLLLAFYLNKKLDLVQKNFKLIKNIKKNTKLNRKLNYIILDRLEYLCTVDDEVEHEHETDEDEDEREHEHEREDEDEHQTDEDEDEREHRTDEDETDEDELIERAVIEYERGVKEREEYEQEIMDREEREREGGEESGEINTFCECGNGHYNEFYNDGKYYCSVKCME